MAFTMAAGAVAFTLALLAGAKFNGNLDDILRGIIVAVVCGTMCWASTERALSGTAEAVDAVTARLAAAAAGDLVSPSPSSIAAELPDLATGLDELFRQMRTMLDSVNDLAMHDSVTLLPNRRHFRREAERVLDELDPDDRAALVFIDLDRFKAVNDNLGHAVGDRLLELVAERLRAITAKLESSRPGERREPLLARLAGDEFTLFLPCVAHSTEAAELAGRVLDAMSAPFALSGMTVEVGASLGVALYPEHGRRLGELMRSADVAMYHAKAHGGQQVQLFTGMLASRQEDRIRQERELRSAIERDEFALAFQPQVDLVTGKAAAAEALLRWRHPEGLRLPSSFLAVAEDSGLICGIGEWVIDRAVETLGRWHAAGLDQRLTIGVSARQLQSPDFAYQLREVLARHGAPAHLLEIGIGERIAMTCDPAVLDCIAELRDDGIAFAIDDFGSGYSNVVRLRDIPLDRVKLDPGLIRDIVRCEKTRAVVQSLLGLVQGLGYATVAEGVETAEQVDLLRALGCDAVQGSGVAEPMSEEDYQLWRVGSSSQRAMTRTAISRARAG